MNLNHPMDYLIQNQKVITVSEAEREQQNNKTPRKLPN